MDEATQVVPSTAATVFKIRWQGHFLHNTTWTANQMEFVDLIVKHLTENGVMDVALLYEPPFTSYAPQGPDALFSSARVEQLFVILRRFVPTRWLLEYRVLRNRRLIGEQGNHSTAELPRLPRNVQA